MAGRTGRSLIALLLALLCLCGCVDNKKDEPDPLLKYNGTWYFYKTAVACQFGDGKIYRDDKSDKSGLILAGIYKDGGGHIDANLTNADGVEVVHPLSIVDLADGAVLVDINDGTVYFYRDPVAAMEAMEALESPPPSEEPPVPETGETEPPNPGGEDEEDYTVRGGMSAEADPASPGPAGSDLVWVPKSGSKYHSTAGCSGMKNPRQVSRAEAERKGFTPCKRCW